MNYQCPDCSDEMTLTEDTHVCNCGASLSIDEAAALFEAGELVGIVDESEVEEYDDVVVADLSEDVHALVEGLNLSEDLANKAKIIMETAVSSRVKAEVAKIEEKAEQYAEYVKEQTEEKAEQYAEYVQEELTEKVDGYLDLVVSEWLDENKIAVEAGLKKEMDESFIDGLADLLKEHYVKAPDQRWDIVEGMSDKVDELEAKLDEALETSIDAKKNLLEAEKAISYMKMSEGLADTQKEKLLSLAEEIEADDISDFSDKLETLKESYFEKSPSSKMVNEAVEEAPVDDSMAEVLRMLAR